MSLDSLLNLAIFVAAVVVTGASGAIFRPGAWYAGLRKPSWTPPNWLFGPAWLALYIMIAISGWRIVEALGWAGAALPMALYGAQLVLNFLWSALFFGLRRMDLAFVDVAALWAAIVGCMIVFHPIDPVAAWLLAPYLAWVSFAAALNFVVWRMNAGDLGRAGA